MIPTINKKILVGGLTLSILLIAAGAITMVVLKHDQQFSPGPASGTNLNQTAALPEGSSCFVYRQAATTDAPYAVTEHVALTRAGKKITGTKMGMQTGPDMTNGYEGALTGTIADEVITADFAYTIEGSRGTEREEYHVTAYGLEKYRYPLKEEHGVLVPDKSQELSATLSYTQEPCM